MTRQYITKMAVGILLASIFTGCASLQQKLTINQLNKKLKHSEIFSNQFTGLVIYDPETETELYNMNGHLAFTPASNMKVYTLLACLQDLGDSIGTFAYRDRLDSVAITPLGDPTFLHPKFRNTAALNFLRDKKIIVGMPEQPMSRYGSGWAWDDYPYSFHQERSYFPIYGNSVRIYQDDALHVEPDFFEHFTETIIGAKPGNAVYRAEEANIFTIWLDHPNQQYDRIIPFKYSEELGQVLLEDTLNTKVDWNKKSGYYADTLYSYPTKYVLAMMMLASDNFLAEHLLINAALSNRYKHVDAYKYALQQQWSDFLPDSMRWIDGSGLSRYNLTTPANMVAALDQIYLILEWNEIEYLFPTGGVSGTLRKYYAAEQPYVFAKTGTLSNNHNLSGYIKTKSGKMLIFSLMNNHYLRSTYELKGGIETILEWIRDHY